MLDLDALLTSFSGGVPCALCEGANWSLLRANDAFKTLLAADDREGFDSSALRDWFARGSFENGGEFPGDGKYGRFLFRHESLGDFLVYWRWLKAENTPLLGITAQKTPSFPALNPLSRDLREMDSILDFIHDGIWVIDGAGITLRINRAMERIAGISAAEVVGKHVSEPLREGKFKTCVTLRALQTRHTVTLFDDYSNGKRCLNTSSPIFDSDGNVWRVIAAIRDITELENLQKRLSNLEVEALAYKLRAEGLEHDSKAGLLGHSAILRRVNQDIAKAAQTGAVTLILGETGSGKSLAAKTIHELSSRAQKPFVTVNCGAIPASLMESELFGYEKGAFTGASRGGKPGMFELAAGGTLLLDEIGELSPPLQAKLLHALDGEPIFRVGGSRPIDMTARLIAATNRPLEKMVREGAFREDLFYRLRVLCVYLPPLRERKEDILLLAAYFLNKSAAETGVTKRLDPRVERVFLTYPWPGNVRELQSVIQSLVTLSDGAVIEPADLPSYMREPSESRPQKPRARRNLNDAVAQLEKEMIAAALAETGSTYKAARLLGVSQSSVARKARKYGISSPAPSPAPASPARPLSGPDLNVL